MPEFPRHQDVEYLSPCVGVRFLWRPYAANISAELTTWAREQSSIPEIVVSGAALWDVLHVRSVPQYSDAMQTTQKTLQELFTQVCNPGVSDTVSYVLRSFYKAKFQAEACK